MINFTPNFTLEQHTLIKIFIINITDYILPMYIHTFGNLNYCTVSIYHIPF